MSATDIRDTGLGQPEMPDFARRDQVFDRPRHILHRYVSIDAVLIEKIDVVGSETFERAFDSGANAFGPAIAGAAARDVEPEFRRDNEKKSCAPSNSTPCGTPT
jgi:hypothetical protein